MSNDNIRIVGVEHAAFPNHLRCDHGCDYIIQVVNAQTDDVEMEFCPLFAESFAGVILNAVELCHLSR